MIKVNTFAAADLLIINSATRQHAIPRTYTKYATTLPYLKNLAPWYPNTGPNNKNTNTHAVKKKNIQNIISTHANSLNVLDNCLATTNCNKSFELSDDGALMPIWENAFRISSLALCASCSSFS